MKTLKLETTEAEIAYDVRGPLPTLDGRPPLFMIGQPMTARTSVWGHASACIRGCLNASAAVLENGVSGVPEAPSRAEVTRMLTQVVTELCLAPFRGENDVRDDATRLVSEP
jgi:hypothetical protein